MTWHASIKFLTNRDDFNQRPRKHLESEWALTKKGMHLSFAALLFHEYRALSFPKKGTFSPGTKSGGITFNNIYNIAFVNSEC